MLLSRRWRRTRPFWAAVLLVLAGTELALVPLAPWSVLLGLGLGGIAALGIGAALVVAGVFLLLRPQTRHYVGLHAVILSVVSFAASNLGGFGIGMLLGIAGGAMAFAWRPVRAAASRPPGPGPAPGGSPSKALAVALPLVLLATALPARDAQRTGPVTAGAVPPTVTTTRFAPSGFTLASVERLPTAAGPRTVMVLRMRAASLRDYRLFTHDGGPELALDVRDLRLRGDVTLYLTDFSGCLQGLLCLSFSADALPVPPVVPPFVFMTDVRARQALITSDVVDADGLRIAPEHAAGALPPGS
ncbi:DUF6114 domain-containing protein [Streptomyces sp. NPDC049555]|uniref:DUF6114 domain-containing protein n=1 Tax=unclassified Streptomyces TaxID=2593676 RepID=UPI00341DF633